LIQQVEVEDEVEIKTEEKLATITEMFIPSEEPILVPEVDQRYTINLNIS